MNSLLEIHESSNDNCLFTELSTGADYTVPGFDLDRVAASIEYHEDYDASYMQPATELFNPKASDLTSDEIESWLLENRNEWKIYNQE